MNIGVKRCDVTEGSGGIAPFLSQTLTCQLVMMMNPLRVVLRAASIFAKSSPGVHISRSDLKLSQTNATHRS